MRAFWILLLLGCFCGGFATHTSAQTAVFSYNDGAGAPNAGTYHAGDSFTFSITLAYTAGGSVNNVAGVSYWLQQKSPSGAPFDFSITLRDPTGSQFTFLQTPALTYPQVMTPANVKDLGGGTQSGAGLPSGNYFVANITIAIDPATINGTYVLSTITTGGKAAVITDDVGHTFNIPEADYTVTVVPEPGTWVGGGLVAALLALQSVRRLRRGEIRLAGSLV